MTEILFNMRSCMTKTFKNNFSSLYKENMKCSLKCSDPNALDSQSHLLQCLLIKKQLTEEEKKQTANIYYQDIFGTLEVQRRVTIFMARMLEIREDLLVQSSLPVGSFTGPVSTITL